MATFITTDIILKKSKTPLHGSNIDAHSAGYLIFRFPAVAHLAHLFRKHR
jgi:hypothetical protein